VENFINQRHRFGNDFKLIRPPAVSDPPKKGGQAENHSAPALFLDFTDKISQGDK